MPIQRRFRTILTARLLLEYRDHYLYLAQTKSNGESFTLPGGKIEGEEFAKEALIREAFEEAAIILTKKSLKLVHVVHKKLRSTTEIIYFFHATTWQGELKVKEPDKFRETAWFPIDERPKRLPAVIQSAMSKIAKGKIFSQFPKMKMKDNSAIKDIVKENVKENVRSSVEESGKEKEKTKSSKKEKKKVKEATPKNVKAKAKSKSKEKTGKVKPEKVEEDANFVI